MKFVFVIIVTSMFSQNIFGFFDDEVYFKAKKRIKRQLTKRIELKCTENCSPSKYTEDILIDVVCSGCGDEGIPDGKATLPSEFTCPLDKPCITVENKNTVIRIKKYSLNSGISFTLTFENSIQNGIIQVQTAGKLMMVKCVDNQNCNPTDPKKKTTLVAMCSSCGAGETFHWVSDPLSQKPFEMSGEDKGMINIPADAFVTCKDVKFEVTRGTTERAAYILRMVIPVPCEEPTTVAPVEEEIVEEAVGENWDSIPALIEKEDFEEAGLRAIHLLNKLEQIENDTFRDHLLKHVVKDMFGIATKVKPTTLHEFLNVAFEVMETVDHKTVSILSIMLRKLTDQIVSRHPSTRDVEVLQETKWILELTTQILELSTSMTFSDVTPSVEDDTYPSYNDMNFKRVEEIDTMRHIALSVVKITKDLGKLSQVEAGYAEMSSENIISTVTVIPFREEVTVRLPKEVIKVWIKQELSTGLPALPDPNKVQVASFSINPFWWDEISDIINTPVVLVDIFSSEQEVKELREPIEIFLPREDGDPGIVEEELASGHWQVHKIEGETGAQLNVVFNYYDQEFIGYVSAYFPTVEDTRTKGRPVVSDNVEQNSWSLVFDAPVAYVSVASDLEESMNYFFELSVIGCVAWDERFWKWNSTACKVGPETKGTVTHCLCNHLSLFAGSFFVPPNRLASFSDMTLTEALKRSATVLAAMGGILVLWIVLMIWAAREDSLFGHREVRLLADRIPGDSFPYLVYVVTGQWRNAGTTAHVAIQLLGDNFCSRVHILTAKGALRQGGEDWFILPTPRPLGNIIAVRLFHDSYGSKPHWYCVRIIVTDVKEKTQFNFLVLQWLSLLFGDGVVERIIPPSEFKKVKRGKDMFPQAALSEIRDAHLWFSILKRPPDSSFTTKERVMTAITLLLLTLLASAMFFGVDVGMGPGVFFLTWKEIAVMIESMLVTLPIGILVTILFRKSRPPPVSSNKS